MMILMRIKIQSTKQFLPQWTVHYSIRITVRLYKVATPLISMNLSTSSSRPKAYVRHNSDASNDSSVVNLHSMPIPDPPRGKKCSSSKKWLLLSLISVVIIGLVVGLSVGLTSGRKGGNTTSSSSASSSADASSIGASDNGSNGSSAVPQESATATLKSVRRTFDLDDDIPLKFVDPSPHEDHWIGVTKAKADADNLMSGDIIEWVFGE